MSGRYLLDTNIVIAIFARDPQVYQRLELAGEVFLPSIVLGELYFGACKSRHVESNLAKVDEFAAANIVLACDLDTAQHYGDLKSQLSTKGRHLPENDIWIAAVTRQHGLTLVSRDAHFDEVLGLSVEAW